MALNKMVMAQPYIDSFMSTAAGGNAGRIFARLKPRSQRKSAQEIVQDLRGKLAAVPGINAFPQMLPTIRIGGQLTKSQYQFTLQAPDTNELYQDAPKLEAKLRSDPQLQKLLQDVTSDLQITNPQVNVDIDRDKASALGVTANQVEDALYTAYGQRQISTIYAPNNAYRVITELENQYQLDPSALSMLYVRSSSGQLVPLERGSQTDAIAGPAHHQSPGPVAGGDHLLQPAPGGFAGRCRQCGGQGRARNAAGHRQHQLSGHGAGL